MLVRIKSRIEIENKYFPGSFCYVPIMLPHCDKIVDGVPKTIIVNGVGVSGVRYDEINWHPEVFTIVDDPITLISENYFISKEVRGVIQKAINDNNSKSK